jgi:hypothetical protein
MEAIIRIGITTITSEIIWVITLEIIWVIIWVIMDGIIPMYTDKEITSLVVINGRICNRVVINGSKVATNGTIIPTVDGMINLEEEVCITKSNIIKDGESKKYNEAAM